MLRSVASVAIGAAMFGATWNLLWGRFLYERFNPCRLVVERDPDGPPFLGNVTRVCPTVPQVPWVLLIVLFTAGVLVFIATIAIEASAERSGPTPAPTDQKSRAETVPVPPKRDRTAFLVNPKLLGAAALGGFILTAIQTFR
ncbi:hypothetical protein SAMN05192558_12714 [Actinokineospora alba]|uniref:Uncharacterized protein n=2 Tax=Actinokineospora alba TaxID=504798 RepID=A0A1H0WNT9_9PSEU|nr:hypothetical protein C8E96_4418 [Actinokineospora alba]SDI73533.1 hypothetical protein SAMN05421871_107121 [Actinokineospora alba]SDP92354.1 hypothetical protein SAMN05192558_12714 [Actinokineospora alba]